ncbi:MAG: multidrug effflux MFS transporter [Pseudomonadota bacterium]
MQNHHDARSVNTAAGGKGVLVFSTLVLCVSFGEVATGLVVPALPTLGAIFDRPPEAVQLVLVSFAVTFAIGQLFFGSFSDRHGRRITLLIGAALTIIGSALSALAETFWLVVLGRAIQGLGAASGIVVSRAMVRDIYGAEGASKALAVLFALMAASFLTAPLVGGALIDFASWQAGFLFAAALGLAWLVSTLTIMPETRPRTSAPEREPGYAVYLGLFRHRDFLAYMLPHSLGYAGIYAFVAGAPFLFIDSFGMSPTRFGLIAAMIMAGFLVGSSAARIAIPRWGMSRVIQASLVIMLAAPGLIVGLALLNWLPVSVLLVIQFIYWFGAGFLAPNTVAGVMMSHPAAAGAAAALLGFIQLCAAAAVSLLQGVMYNGSLYPMIGTQLLLGFAAWLAWRRLARYTA